MRSITSVSGSSGYCMKLVPEWQYSECSLVGYWVVLCCALRVVAVYTLSVVLAGGYLAYLCSSMPDTGSMGVGIPRVVLGVWGVREHR